MQNAILQKHQIVTTPEKDYKIEFDNHAYAIIEEIMDKSALGIFKSLINGTPSMNDCSAIVYCGLLKHYDEETALEVKELFENNKSLIFENLQSLSLSFVVPMMPPEALNKDSAKQKKAVKKKK